MEGLTQFSLFGKSPVYRAMLGHSLTFRWPCPISTVGLTSCGRGDELPRGVGAHTEFVYVDRRQ